MQCERHSTFSLQVSAIDVCRYKHTYICIGIVRKMMPVLMVQLSYHAQKILN